MKKVFINSLICILVVLGIVVTTVTVAFGYISDKVLQENIGDNLKSVISTSTASITNHLESEYKVFETTINTIEKENQELTLDEKLARLESIKDQYILFDNIHGGFGGYLIKDNKPVYYINGLYYQDVNSSYTDLDNEDDFLIFNFGDSSDIKVEGGLTSEFEDKSYIVLKINEIIVYFDAEAYFNQVINKNGLIDTKNILITYPDGKITYQNNNTKHGLLYQMLLNEYTETGIVDDVKKVLSNPDEVITKCISGIRYKGETCYLLANTLSTKSFHTKLCLVEIINYDRSTSPIKQALVPLIAADVLIVCIVLALIIFYYLHFSRKSNDIDFMVYQRYNEPIFKIKVSRQGNILKMDKNIKKLLVNYKDYTKITDFTFKEVYPDYNIAMMTQKPLTIKLAPSQVNGGNTVYLRCLVLRFFGDYVVTAINATQDEQDNNHYLNLALYNSETKLPNEKLFKHNADKYISQIIDNKNNGLVSLVLLKIKNFASFRSIYGKFIRDAIINNAKEKLESILDPRYQTLYYCDEAIFGIQVDGMEKYTDFNEVIEKIEAEFKKPIIINKNMLILEPCFAIYDLDIETYKHKDAELIYTKLLKLLDKIDSSTINKAERYSLANERFISSEDLLEEDLRNAIENNEFEMYLQPQYNTDDKRICGAEFLIRWNNPKYYYQSPLHFIELSEKNGLIVQISKFINEQSMIIAKKLEKYNIEFSLNVSPVQIVQAGFVNEFIELAEKYEVNPSTIALEITETALIDKLNLTIEKLNLLRDYGFKIHLDDFCTGYSSMKYLNDLPINAIKIDKDFIHGLNTEKHSRAIVSKITDLAKTLELDIIAEGVEDEKQVQFLMKHGCNIIQGFIISKAVPFDQAVELLEGFNVTKTIDLLSDKKKK